MSAHPRLLTVTTAQQLADYLDVPEKRLRAWLRKDYPAKAPGQGDQWTLTPEMKTVGHDDRGAPAGEIGEGPRRQALSIFAASCLLLSQPRGRLRPSRGSSGRY
jgi:hypothetical protein